MWLKEVARLCGLDWFHIQLSIHLQMCPDALRRGRTGFVVLPLPGSETFVHFLQVLSACPAVLDTKHKTQLWTSSGLCRAHVSPGLFPLHRISHIAIACVKFYLPFDPCSLTACPCPQTAPYQWPTLSPPSSPLFQAEVTAQTQTPWKVTATMLPYENWLCSPDLRFLFFSPLFVDSRTSFLMPEWLHFLRSFLCSLISSLSSFLG